MPMPAAEPGALRALLWDVDGTLAETERDGHRIAFNLAFERLGLGWRWDEARYVELLAVTGGRERLLHDMAGRSDAPALAGERLALAAELHRLKNGFEVELVLAGAVALALALWWFERSRYRGLGWRLLALLPLLARLASD